MTKLDRMSEKTLDQAMPEILRPRYDRSRVRTGIVHLGLGNFHRAHQAVYTEAVLAGGDMAWGIAGVSLRSPRMREALAPQNGLYSVTEEDGDSIRTRIIGALTEVLCAPEDPERVLARLCHEDVKIVTLTITEAGYVLNDGEVPDWLPGNFHLSSAPALVYLVEALYRRRERGLPPFTLLSCDNLSANGQALRSAVLAVAEMRDPGLATYLAETLRCPSTMVDRIVPQPTDDDLNSVSARIGLVDRAAIITEPFSQWIIEDDFATGRPDWALSGGVVFTDDVSAFEEMKLRLLNGAHTFIALFGQIAGEDYVSDVMEVPEARRFLDRFWRAGRLTLDTEYDLDAYTSQLVARFENPRLRHRTSQIASDTSLKLPQRIVEPLAQLLATDGDAAAHAAVLVLWYAYLRRASEVIDPRADELTALARSSDILTFVGQSGVFPEEPARNETLAGLLTTQDAHFARTGVTGLLSLINEG